MKLRDLDEAGRINVTVIIFRALSHIHTYIYKTRTHREDVKLRGLEEAGRINVTAIVLLALSCIWGTAISFLGFLCLENVSSMLHLLKYVF